MFVPQPALSGVPGTMSDIGLAVRLTGCFALNPSSSVLIRATRSTETRVWLHVRLRVDGIRGGLLPSKEFAQQDLQRKGIKLERIRSSPSASRERCESLWSILSDRQLCMVHGPCDKLLLRL